MMRTDHGAYRCDRCAATATARRCPPGWRLRDTAHICPTCWPTEPAERVAVYRYGIIGQPSLPAAFWSQQRAARALWDALCAASAGALAQAQALRARYAPVEVAAADARRAEAAVAWDAVAAARSAWRTAPQPSANTDPAMATAQRAARSQLHAAYREAQRTARNAGQRCGVAYAAAKRAARAAGCDEAPIWALVAALHRDAPRWTWSEMRDADERPQVVRDPAGWRLVRSLADQVIEEYQTAWTAWVSGRREGRGIPRPHGQGIRDRVRAVLRYSNGQSAARLAAGTPSLTVRPLTTDAAGRTLAEVVIRVSGDESARAQVVLHRPLPTGPDAIRRVELCGARARWDRWVWTLHVTIREPLAVRPAMAERAAAVAVDLRWRMDDGRLQVAHWLGTDGRQDQVRIDPVRRRSKVARGGLPSSWVEHAAWQARSDELFDGVKAAVWTAHAGAAPYTERYRRLRSRGLLRAWRAGDYPLAADELSEWARWHITTQRTIARCRARLEARRDQHYYEAAHAVCRMAGTLVIEGSGGQAMDLRPLASGDDPLMGGQRHIVAPSRWRTILMQVAQRYAVPVAVIECAYTSRTCPSCGMIADSAGAAVEVMCPAGHRFDQRFAACRELLRRWSERERSGDGGMMGGARGAEVGDSARGPRGRRGHQRRVKGRTTEPLADQADSAAEVGR